MNAVEMLKKQHREVEKLFQQFSDSESVEARQEAFYEIADALAVHATIEEKHFYPTVKKQQTEAVLLESVEEHLEIKRDIAELLAMDAAADDFGDKVNALQENVEHHVEEEEGELFPQVERLFSKSALEDLGAVMDETQEQLRRQGSPRDAIPGETAAAAPL